MQGQGYLPELRSPLGQWVAVHMPGIYDLVSCRRDTWAERAMVFALVANTRKNSGNALHGGPRWTLARRVF